MSECMWWWWWWWGGRAGEREGALYYYLVTEKQSSYHAYLPQANALVAFVSVQQTQAGVDPGGMSGEGSKGLTSIFRVTTSGCSKLRAEVVSLCQAGIGKTSKIMVLDVGGVRHQPSPHQLASGLFNVYNSFATGENSQSKCSIHSHFTASINPYYHHHS